MTAVTWKDGRALLAVCDTTVSLTQTDAATLARDLADGQYPACFGYPMPSGAEIGGYVIDVVTRVANGNTIVEFGRVSGYTDDPGRDPYLYSGAWRVTLAPIDRDALVAQLKSGSIL